MTKLKLREFNFLILVELKVESDQSIIYQYSDTLPVIFLRELCTTNVGIFQLNY